MSKANIYLLYWDDDSGSGAAYAYSQEEADGWLRDRWLDECGTDDDPDRLEAEKIEELDEVRDYAVDKCGSINTFGWTRFRLDTDKLEKDESDDDPGCGAVYVETGHYVTAQDIADAVTTALEGGSNHWLGGAKSDCDWPDAVKADAGPWYSQAAFYKAPTWKIVLIDGEDGEKYEVDRASMRVGLVQLAEDYPTYWRDMLGEDGDGGLDADGADVLLQLAMTGGKEVIYG